MSITRRLFLRHTAIAGTLGATAVTVKAAEGEMTPREQAIWHMRELERLVREDGATEVVVQAIGMHYSGCTDCRLIGIHYSGRLMDYDGMFAETGGAA